MFEFLPFVCQEELKKINGSIREIRLRTGNRMTVNVDGEKLLLRLKNPVTTKDFESVILKITEHSLYAHTQTIKQGFLSTSFGLRIGICGTVVVENEAVKIIKEVTSMCIRVPHEIVGSSDYILQSVFHSGLKNLLVISPPGKGKTTLIRDLCRNLSAKLNQNVLVVDERRELFSSRFNFGDNVDFLLSSPKNYGFYMGIRTMCPDVIAVDELFSFDDANGVINAISSGVFVIASCHGRSVEDVKNKTQLKSLFEVAAFDYAVVLSRVGQRGEVVKLK